MENMRPPISISAKKKNATRNKRGVREVVRFSDPVLLAEASEASKRG